MVFFPCFAVFDFDGTIADTLGETRRILNQIGPDYGIRHIEEHEVNHLRHMSLKQLIDHLKIPKRKLPALLSRGTGLMRANITRLNMIDGMPEGAGRPVSTGVGLVNIRNRLMQGYGDDHLFETRSQPGGGFTVLIEIPYEPEEAKAAPASPAPGASRNPPHAGSDAPPNQPSDNVINLNPQRAIGNT